jgi:hypothetical protein
MEPLPTVMMGFVDPGLTRTLRCPRRLTLRPFVLESVPLLFASFGGVPEFLVHWDHRNWEGGISAEERTVLRERE